MLWHCCLSARKSIRPMKNEWWGAGVVICLEWSAHDLHRVQLIAMLPDRLLLHWNLEWFWLSGTGRLSWKRGQKMGVVVFVVSVSFTVNIIECKCSSYWPVAYPMCQSVCMPVCRYCGKMVIGSDAVSVISEVGQGMSVLDGGYRRRGKGSFGMNLGHLIVTNWDLAATRSSQITLGRTCGCCCFCCTYLLTYEWTNVIHSFIFLAGSLISWQFSLIIMRCALHRKHCLWFGSVFFFQFL